MSVSHFVRYEGQAGNTAALVARYRDEHMPMLERFSGIRRLVLDTPAPWQDPDAVTPDRFALIAQIEFDSVADLKNAPRSENRRDFAQLPPFDGPVYHQAASSEEVWAR